MIDINKLSERAHACAVRRGKITKKTTWEDWMKALSSEVIELALAGVIRFEAADIVITLLSLSKEYEIDLEKSILEKMDFNEKRSD